MFHLGDSISTARWLSSIRGKVAGIEQQVQTSQGTKISIKEEKHLNTNFL